MLNVYVLTIVISFGALKQEPHIVYGAFKFKSECEAVMLESKLLIENNKELKPSAEFIHDCRKMKVNGNTFTI